MRAVSICAIAVLGLLDTGCLDTRPIHYYTLQTPPAPSAPATPSGPALLVGNISVPLELQDDRIHFRVGSNEVGAYQFHRWIDRPGTMVSESLVRALRATGKYRSVMEASSAAAGDYILRGRLNEFEEVDRETIRTSIWLQVDLVDMKTRQVVWGDRVQREEPVESKSVPEVVASLDRNLQAVVKQAAEGVGHFLEAQR